MNKMKVFIFGAGASRGSQNQEGWTPDTPYLSPLVDDLFLPQYKRFNLSNPNDDTSHCFLTPREWDECADNTGRQKSLELWLTQRWSAIDSKKQPSTQFAEKAFFAKVVFYVWNLCQRISNTYGTKNGYVTLLGKLKQYDEPFGMISFNYDTLLDRAIQEVYGREMSDFADYRSMNYVKPHGSVNWILLGRPDEMVTKSEGIFDVGTRIDTAIAKMYNGDSFQLVRARVYNPRHKDLNLFDNLVVAHNRQHFYPLLFIPLTSKLYSTVGGFADDVIKRGRFLLGEAQEIYLVGYRAQDEIIKEMFTSIATPKAGQKKTKLHVVGISDSEQIMGDALKLSENLDRGNIYSDGFMTFAESYRG